jgi:two-component system cell cycle sensor histidine kinase/response regulator CckA
MFGLGIYSWIAGALQLFVPSYALRLVRRFGTQRVGWFIVTAFVSLALLHLLGPQKPGKSVFASAAGMELIYAVGSVLLIIGMGHMETIFAEREQAQSSKESLKRQLESRVQEETTFLARTNQTLIHEIARRDEIQSSLEESRARYQSLFTGNPQPMWILDARTGRFLAVNRAALDQYGFSEEEFLGLGGSDLLLPAAVAGFLQDLAKPCGGPQARGIWRHCRKDGTLIDVDTTAVDLMYEGSPARLVVATDVTRRRRRELQLRKLHKMEVIGQVAGGVAHHFNTLFARIETQTAALRNHPLDLKSAEEVEHISAAVKQAAALTRQLLIAGGRQPASSEPLDLNGLIRNLAPTLRRLTGEGVLLESALGSRLPPVTADPRLLEHVILHLVQNARQAMNDSGTLTIGTAKVHLEKDDAAMDPEARAGDFVRMEVRDTGCGMTPQLQSHLFEPFFTTREGNQGIGLGLASVYGAVKQMSGWITLSTHDGTGTECRVFLPCALPAIAPPQPLLPATSAQAKGIVLLVEAEDRARALARFVLNRHGYRVIEADSADTAMVLWAGQAGYIDLLLVSSTLPRGTTGRELATRLVNSKPSLKVIYSCEPNAEAEPQADAPDSHAIVVTKPFAAEALVRSVEDALA